jgi:tetratricopeptide (TPR) repeat protein
MIKGLEIYILHCAFLKEREQSVNNVKSRLATLTSVPIKDIKVITEKDPNDIAMDEIHSIVNYTPVPEPNAGFLNQFIKNIHIHQLSQTLKHKAALSHISQLPEGTLGLVIEDDALFNENVCDDLSKVLAEYKNEPIVYLGMPAEQDAKTKILRVDRSKYALIPLTESYLITPVVAKVLLDGFFPIRFTCNFQMNYLLLKHNVEVYQSATSLFVNGSRYGMFVSTQNPNNALVFNRDYMTLLELLNKNEYTKEEADKIAELIKQTPIAKHPDFQYLVARYYTKQGEYQQAIAAYEAAYNTLIANNAIVNHESTMLKDYIRLHKLLQ